MPKKSSAQLSGAIWKKTGVLSCLCPLKNKSLSKVFYPRNQDVLIVWFFLLGALIVSLWCQPMIELSYQQIAKELDSIALKVIDALQRKSIQVSLCKT